MAAAQQMMISPEDLQQLLQASAATQQPNMDWNANAELIHQLQQMQQVLFRSLWTPIENPAGWLPQPPATWTAVSKPFVFFQMVVHDLSYILCISEWKSMLVRLRAAKCAYLACGMRSLGRVRQHGRQSTGSGAGSRRRRTCPCPCMRPPRCGRMRP